MELQSVADHPGGQLSNVGENSLLSLCQRGWYPRIEGDIKLRVVSIEVELQAVTPNDITHKSRVEGEDQWPRHQTLRHAALEPGLC